MIHGVEKVVQGKVLHIQEGLVGGDYDEKGGQVVVVRWEVLHIQEGPVGGVHEQEDGEVAGCVHRVQEEVLHIQEGLVVGYPDEEGGQVAGCVRPWRRRSCSRGSSSYTRGSVGGVYELEGGEVAGCVHGVGKVVQGEVLQLREGLVGGVHNEE